MTASRFSRFLSVLQKLGQSLMIPVSVLPAAGLVVALGRTLQNAGKGTLTHDIGQVLYSGGLAVFEQLPVIFAIGVAIGFTGGAGVAGLSAAAGYFTLVSLLKVFTEIRGLELALNTGVFGGIVIGLMTAWLYNRYHEKQLHAVLGFFSGKRLVPILTVFSTLILSFGFAFFWPPIQEGINHFGLWVMNSTYGGAFYAAGKRLLIPVGLHHVFYQPFLFQFGEFTTTSGQIVHGDSARYFAGDPTAGIFMASEFPIMLFGLPAAALAIVLRARPERRKAIAGVMLTAALTSIITGITEPIEFSFIFVAPLLYILHVALAFLSGFLTQFFNIHLGYTFSASLIDFGLGYFNQLNSFYLWAVVGPLMAVLYFSLFYFLIGLFQYKTPGRDADDALDETPVTSAGGNPTDVLAAEVLSAMGGAGNLSSLDACITRLRTVVVDPSRVDQARLKRLGAAGIFHDGRSNFQVVFGTKSDILKGRMQVLMRQPGAAPAGAAAAPPAPAAPPVAKNAAPSTRVFSPLKGRVLPLEQVPDQTFAGKILGEGLAIEPAEGVVYAPFDGTVLQMFKTGHAVGLGDDRGVELLIHVGIDTVKLGGEGFRALVKNGDVVRRGDRLIEFDLERIRSQAPSVITPVVVTNTADFKAVRALAAAGEIRPGQELLDIQI
ncbi:MAG: glucose PTS transporter subunit IIA [Bdellovibrionaceae bacterium]|nr:glucose PTS transporter subunit IIA [Pseudobdellovibrionaceae bacterium]